MKKSKKIHEHRKHRPLQEARKVGVFTKSFKKLDTDGIDLCNPMEEPNPALDENSGHQKSCLDSFFEAGWFGAKTMPHKATRKTSCSSGQLQI